MLKNIKHALLLCLMLVVISPVHKLYSQGPLRTLRIAYHVFQDDAGWGNFDEDSVDHIRFLNDICSWINNKVLHLDSLMPSFSSAYVPSMNIQIRLDSIYFHQDTYAWDCDDQIDAEYMRKYYVDQDSSLSYRQKYQTLPVFIGGNYPRVGGHNSLPGDKRYIAMRGLYNEYSQKEYADAVYECARNLLHEIGHSLGLSHNFQGGEHGSQCDECEDNGCPEEGTSNNIMDYWPAYGHALSVCQLGIINLYLSGNQGNISDVLINDSCYTDKNTAPKILTDRLLEINDTTYLHQALEIGSGGVLIVKSYLSLPDGESIVIHPGGEIYIYGGTIGNLCGNLWGGIVIPADSSSGALALPRVEIVEGGAIEYARKGISVSGRAELKIDHAHFRDCLTAIDISGKPNDTLKLRNCTFLVRKNIPHSDEGAGLERFVRCSNETVIIDSCNFINDDPFRGNMADGAGNGIEADQCNLHLRASLFENLNHGIFHTGNKNIGSFYADNLQFRFCVAGIQLFGSPVSVIKNCVFRIERFNELPAFGLYAEEIGWLNMLDNHLYSQYGGDQQVAVLIDQPRGGTQLIHHNTMGRMTWGIIHLAGPTDPVWPDNIFDSIGKPLLNRGLGVVLVNNQMDNNLNNYSILLPDGRGVSSGSKDPDVSVSHFADAASWPLGGLALLSQHNEVAMVKGRSISDQVPYMDINFYLNSEPGKECVIPTDTSIAGFDDCFRLMQANWLNDPFPTLSPNSTVETWARAEEVLVKDPVRGRISRERDLYMKSVKDWPVWALSHLANLSAIIPPTDCNTMKAIYSLALNQMEVLGEGGPLPDMNQLSRTGYAKELQIPITTPAFRARIPTSAPAGQKFDIYPNPASAELFVSLKESLLDNDRSSLSYAIIDAGGRVIITATIENFSDLRVETATLSAGEYAILIWTNKTFYGHRKFIILRD